MTGRDYVERERALRKTRRLVNSGFIVIFACFTGTNIGFATSYANQHRWGYAVIWTLMAVVAAFYVGATLAKRRHL